MKFVPFHTLDSSNIINTIVNLMYACVTVEIPESTIALVALLFVIWTSGNSDSLITSLTIIVRRKWEQNCLRWEQNIQYHKRFSLFLFFGWYVFRDQWVPLEYWWAKFVIQDGVQNGRRLWSIFQIRYFWSSIFM